MVLKDVIRRFAYSSGETLADSVQEKLMHNPLSESAYERRTKSNERKKKRENERIREINDRILGIIGCDIKLQLVS